jgi:hypothetical protein
MSYTSQKTWLLMLVLLNIFVSLGHYVHNIIFLPDYHEPLWITPALIDSLWFIMTPFSCVGYWMFFRNKTQLSYVLFYVYCSLSLLVLGHYWVTPIWTLSLFINVVIFSEAIAAVILATYIFWLQRQSADESAI